MRGVALQSRDHPAFSAAKAEKLRDVSECRAIRAGIDLAFAVEQMKDRLETEKKEGLFFYVDDQVFPPGHFSERMSVQVNYRWRPSIEDQWALGSVTFLHTVDLQSYQSRSTPKLRSSAAKWAEAREDLLFDTWVHLVRLALFSVRDYFRDGGSGEDIPETFQVRTDPSAGVLNNFSFKFWA